MPVQQEFVYLNQQRTSTQLCLQRSYNVQAHGHLACIRIAKESKPLSLGWSFRWGGLERERRSVTLLIARHCIQVNPSYPALSNDPLSC